MQNNVLIFEVSQALLELLLTQSGQVSATVDRPYRQLIEENSHSVDRRPKQMLDISPHFIESTCGRGHKFI